LSTNEVVEILENPGGGLDVPKPKPFPFVPVMIIGGLALLFLGRK
jgi:prepilin signal peptidase PulO-like enzyme (type II secretory pathway)